MVFVKVRDFLTVEEIAEGQGDSTALRDLADWLEASNTGQETE